MLIICERAKVCMMIAVILYHSLLAYAGRDWFSVLPIPSDKIIGSIALWLNTIHIYVFTFASGYLYQYLRFECGRYATFKELWAKKSKRLLLPYAVVSLLWCVPFSSCLFQTSDWEIFRKYMLGFGPAQLWYILMLFMVFILVHPIAGRLQSSKGGQWYAVEALIYFCSIFVGHIIALPFQIPAALKHIPFFLMGMFFRKEKQEISVPWYVLAFLHIVLFGLWHEIFVGNLLYEKLLRGALRPILHYVGILMVISLIKSLGQCQFWDTRLYHFFVEHSFVMYLFHQQIIYCMLTMFYDLLSPFLAVAVNFMGAIAISAMIGVLADHLSISRIVIGR